MNSRGFKSGVSQVGALSLPLGLCQAVSQGRFANQN